LKARKILVVDDDKIVLESCRRILEAEGYRVFLVESAREAIDLLEEQYIDLMLMDVKMPQQDGVYILDKIREKWSLDIWPELPVLVMSGYPTPATIRELKESGARDFISKPFTPDELLDAITTILKRRENESAGN